MGGEDAENLMKSGWRMALHDPDERKRVKARFDGFCKSVCSYDRHKLLSLTGIYTINGSRGQLQSEGAYTEIAELEFLQAIALTCLNSESDPLPHAEVSAFWRELMTQCHVASAASDESTDLVSKLARMHAAYYRNPYGDEFFDRMVSEITAEYDNRYLRDGRIKKAGLALITIRAELWDRYVKYYNNKLTCLTGLEHEIYDVMLSMEIFSSKLEISEIFGKLNIEDLRISAFQIVEDDAVAKIFVLDRSWIDKQLENGVEVIEILESLSLDFVDDQNGENIAAANPVWAAPFIRIQDGYALYSPFTLTSFPFRCLLNLLKNDVEAKTRLEKIRGWFVEKEGMRLMREAFPSAQIVAGGFWQRSPSERVEADLLVLTAGRLFIMESKGSLIPDRVRFGAKDATAQFLKSIWKKAAEQGAALARHISHAIEPVIISDKRGNKVLEIDPKSIMSISRFGLSVEQVGPLMNSREMLRKCGIWNETSPIAPCIILSELAQVFNNAKAEVQKLHYLVGRFDISQELEIIGDELDIYTTYLQYGFLEIPSEDSVLMLLGASYALENYRDGDGVVHMPARSSLRNSPYLDAILSQSIESKSPGYFELALMLMDWPLSDQVEFESKILDLFSRPPVAEESLVFSLVNRLREKSAVAIVYMQQEADISKVRQIGIQCAEGVGGMLEANQVICIIHFWKSVAAYDAMYVITRHLAKKS